MLDAFEIVTSSGIVLWRKHYSSISPHLVNSLIQNVFIEERAGGQKDGVIPPAYKKEKYTLKWTSAKDVGLVFVVGKSATMSFRIEDSCRDGRADLGGNHTGGLSKLTPSLVGG